MFKNLRRKQILLANVILCLLFLSLTNTVNAQVKKRFFHVAYAYSYDHRVLYISNLFSVEHPVAEAGIHNQWHDQFKALRGEDYYNFTITVTYGMSELEATETRNKEIHFYKSKNFRIEYTSFRYIRD